MRTGEILQRFKAKDGREVILRVPRWEDLDDLLDFINSLAEEDLEVLPELKKMTRDEEADWLAKRLAEIEKGKVINIVAEVEGKVVANSQVKLLSEPSGHVGVLGITVRSGYRETGIGTQMINVLAEESRKANMKILILYTFEGNKRAIHVYEKCGFKETGRIPKGICRKGRYVDEIIMTKQLS